MDGGWGPGTPCRHEELTGSLKLKVFEIERAGFTMEEVSHSRQRFETENTSLGGSAMI